MFDSELPGSPEQILGAFKDGKTTYAKIFECLSRFVDFMGLCSLKIIMTRRVPVTTPIVIEGG